jgi:hypothetical protein
MKAWKLIGYIFAGLGTFSLLYGFFVGFTETINPSAILSAGSSDVSMDSFFSLFLSAISPWMILAVVLFIVGGVGLYLGKDEKRIKLPIDQESINARFEMLEMTVDKNFQTISKRLDSIEEQQKNG